MTEAIQSISFTGHMIDLPDRSTRRLPAELESAANDRIARSIRQIIDEGTEPPIGFSSAARGGDILFHEAARMLGLKTTIVLPFPPEVFIETSVGGLESGNWETRFWTLWQTTPETEREVMNLPQNNDAYALCNSRLIELAVGRGRFHLIALWDGKGGDGPGGTADMVTKARAQSDEPSIISPHELY